LGLTALVTAIGRTPLLAQCGREFLRIGIDTGPVVAGVIRRQKFSYDLSLVVLEFKDLAAVKRWYQSEVYQKAKMLREGAAHLRVVAVQGLD
jgi:uncharacterized protein (DUF1330 family)